MKQNKTKTRSFALLLSLLFVFTGCGQTEGETPAGQGTGSVGPSGGSVQSGSTGPSGGSVQSENTEPSGDGVEDSSAGDPTTAPEQEASAAGIELEVCFGDDGEPFTLYLYDNDTAAAIARHVGTASWRLPIYHYDDYDNWESMQYYDIPSRYEIPSDAETVTSAKGGEVYYSEPNRIVLFYHDAEISAEYTRVGYFDYTDEFVAAVENNPVLAGWDTKMVLIKK